MIRSGATTLSPRSSTRDRRRGRPPARCASARRGERRAGVDLVGGVGHDEPGQLPRPVRQRRPAGVGDAGHHGLAEPRRVVLDVGDRPHALGQVRGAAVPRPHVADLHRSLLQGTPC